MLKDWFNCSNFVVQLTPPVIMIWLIFVIAINLNFIKSQDDDVIIPEHLKLDLFVMDAVKKLTFPILRKYLTSDRDALSRLGERLALVAERALDNEIASLKFQSDVVKAEGSNSEYEQLESTKTQHEVSIVRENVEKELSTAESSEDLLPEEMKLPYYRTLKPKRITI